MLPARPVLQLSCRPIPLVRIAFVGMGRRGMKTLERYRWIEGAEVRAIADPDPAATQAAAQVLKRTGRPQADLYNDAGDWQSLCRRADIDLIYICTEWTQHAHMACYAMEHGKHVAVEVPAATTVQECFDLVETACRTRRHCFMTENCCYDRFALATQELTRRGLLGDVTHCEGAYIHDLRALIGLADGVSAAPEGWMEHSYASHGGNPYPTHGMGPIGWLLGLHRGERLQSLTSLTSRGHGCEGAVGRVNNTLIQTAGGRTVLLQFDVTTPRPYSRLQTICGTRGFAQKYPVPTLQLDGQSALYAEEALSALEPYETSEASRLWQKGHTLGVPNEMNYAMDCRLVHCLREGLPLDIDVYDAAEWSCLAELSQRSARQGGRPVEIPDFTQGHWREVEGFRFY